MVTGRARYTLDVAVPGVLHMKLLRSPHAHARIVSIDARAALAVPGVRAVLTHMEAPQRTFSTARHDIPPTIPSDTRVLDCVVRFVGQRVAAVVADTEGGSGGSLPADRRRVRAVARRLRSGGSDARPAPPSPCRGPRVAFHGPRNILAEIHSELGDVAAGFADADVVHEATYETQRVQHAHLETHAAIGWLDEAGGPPSGPAPRRHSWQATRSAICSTCPANVHVFC